MPGSPRLRGKRDSTRIGHTGSPGDISEDVDSPHHFALYTLKALAFIHLRRDENDKSRKCLDKIAELGAMETVGGTVIAALAAGVG